MAEVDFSNARITPIRNTSNNMSFYYINLPRGLRNCFDVSSNTIGTLNGQVITNRQKQAVLLYQGSFTASGTEFYMANSGGGWWKISNISFQSGDTFIFKIRADLICQ